MIPSVIREPDGHRADAVAHHRAIVSPRAGDRALACREHEAGALLESDGVPA